MSFLPLAHRIDAALGARSLLVAARGPGVPARRGGSADSQTAPSARSDRLFSDWTILGTKGYVLLDLTELSSYLPVVPCFEFGNASGTLFPCTEGRVQTRMTSAGTPRAGAFLLLRPHSGKISPRSWRPSRVVSMPCAPERC